MPTIKEIKKYGSEFGFTQAVTDLGFMLGPSGYWFYRKRAEFIDFVDIWRKSSGEWIQISMPVYVSEMIDGYDMSDFPEGFLSRLKNPSGTFLDEHEVSASGVWKVGTREDAKRSFESASQAVASHGEQWFRSINTREALYSSIEEQVKEGPAGLRLRKALGINAR